MAKARTIRAEPPSVMDEIDRWCDKFPRIKELMDGSKWRLCREPEKGYKFAGDISEFLYKVQRPSEHFPAITIRYKYTDEEVIILGIKIIPQL
jgi:hypothetical protein